jgi:hypothetical protein
MAPRSRVQGAALSRREGHQAILRSRLNTVLGVLGLIVFIVCVIALAAGVTAAVVRISPTRDKAKQAGSGNPP